jgi:hypothetical protein
MLWLEKLSTLTPIETAFWGGSAVIAIPLIVNFLKDLYFDRRKRKEERVYISVQLVFILENFVMKCLRVSWDKGYPLDAPEPQPEDYEEQVSAPIFDMSSVKGEHKFLKPTTLYDLQSIHVKLYEADVELNLWMDGNGYSYNYLWQYYELRRELYLNIAKFAFGISDGLRTEFKMKQTEKLKLQQQIRVTLNGLNRDKAWRQQLINERKAEQESMK